MACSSLRGALVCASAALLLNLLGSRAADAAAGNTPGTYGVSADGAAQYDIPLTLPPGLAGLEPRLSLSYSSRRTNALLGMGWTIAGLSVIERCGKTLDQDNAVAGVTMTSSDKFCLDGNKLRLTGGTYGAAGATYRTELETFSKVTQNGAVSWFKVQGKDGLTYEYGNSADSRIEAKDSTIVRAWALSKVYDRYDNYIRFYYTEDTDNGSYRPLRVEYTGREQHRAVASLQSRNAARSTRTAIRQRPQHGRPVRPVGSRASLTPVMC
jgi:hypothetical protein